MTLDKTPSDALAPCPFCGAGETHIHVNKGTWNGQGYGEPVSVEVRHWCADVPGQPSRMISRAGRDEASATAAWNTRWGSPVVAGEPVAELVVDELTELRKEDTETIRQLVEALKYHRAQTRPIHQTNEAIIRGRARLEGKQ